MSVAHNLMSIMPFLSDRQLNVQILGSDAVAP